MDRLLKFCSLTPREKQFFCEAGVLLLLSSLCVRTIAFRHIDSLLRARWKDRTQGCIGYAEDIKLVNRSVSRAANLLPWKSLCLSRSIAAFIMFRRRGIPAVMVTGVKVLEDSSLVAHAWIDTNHETASESSENSTFTAVVRIGLEQ